MSKYLILKEEMDGEGFFPYKLYDTYIDCLEKLREDIKYNISNDLDVCYEIYSYNGEYFTTTTDFLLSNIESLYDIEERINNT